METSGWNRGRVCMNLGVLVLGTVASACGGNAPEDFDENTGTVEQEIVNGYTTPNPTYSGIVEVVTPAGGCSGVLMKNLAIMTAKHCVAAYVNSPGSVSVLMGAQATVGQQIAVHDTKDVAVVRLANRLATYVNGQISYNNYVRAIYTGSDASLNNHAVMLLGYGANTNNCGGFGTLRHAAITTQDDGIPGMVIAHPNANGQIGHLGDSGGPILDGLSPYASAVAGIQTDCGGWSCPAGTPPSVCWYDTPEVWGGWAYLALFNIPK